MLVLNRVTILCQNLGTILAIFLQGDKIDIERRYYSFYNYGATNGELEYWCDNTGLLWLYSDKYYTAEEKLYKAFVHGALTEILNKGHTKRRNPFKLAWDIAEARVAKMQFVNWYCPDFDIELYSLADSVKAEVEGDDWLGEIVKKTSSHEGFGFSHNNEEMELDSE
jgi:hypothetical protein